MNGKRATVLVIAGLFAFVLPGGAADPNIFADNPSIPIDRSKYPFLAPIGELESIETHVQDGQEMKNYGTGFLVSPCYILTNAHVALGDDILPIKGKGYRMIFRAGTGKKTTWEGNTIATPVLWSKRNTVGGNDWALMRLNACVGRYSNFGWFEATKLTGEQMVDLNASAAGFQGRRERGAMDIGPERIMGVTHATSNLLFSGSFTHGQSGGPALAIENGQVTATGLLTWLNLDPSNLKNQSFSTYSNARANEFQNVGLALNHPDLKALLDDDKANFGAANPNAEPARMENLPWISR